MLMVMVVVVVVAMIIDLGALDCPVASTVCSPYYTVDTQESRLPQQTPRQALVVFQKPVFAQGFRCVVAPRPWGQAQKKETRSKKRKKNERAWLQEQPQLQQRQQRQKQQQK